MGRGRLTALGTAAACALFAPTGASAAPTWHAVDAGVPASVRLASVAATRIASDEVVVATGTDAATGQAVAYRLAHGAWQQDVLPAGAGAPSHVAIAAGHAYAVDGSTVLTLADAQAAGPASWSAASGPGTLTAFAVAPDGSGGFAGLGDGHLYAFAPASGGFTQLNDAGGQAVPANGGITAVAAASGGAGVATAKRQDPQARFFALGQGVTPQAAVDGGGSCGTDPLAVAAAGSVALAIDGTCWWELVNGAWMRQGTDGAFLLDGARLHDVALTPDGGAAAIAGESGTGQGTVWRRVAQFGWAATVGVSPAPLEAVSAVAADDIWAVGDSGVVAHLFSDPAPTGGATSGTPGTGGGTTQQTSGSGASQQTTSSHTGQSSGPSSPSGLKIIIDDGSQPQRTSGSPTYSTSGGGSKHKSRTPAGPRRLLRNVRVRAVRHGLRIDFRLAAPAKVSVVALRGKHAIGRARPRVFRSGAGRIVLHYKGGKPPTTLRIVARRSHKTGAPVRPAATDR